MENNFRSTFQISNPDFTISHKDVLMNIGSCFSENIGQLFIQYKFNININPFGQQYNPLSIAKAIERLLNPIPYSESDLVYRDELYHSFDHHGDFSFPQKTETIEYINQKLTDASFQIKKATVLFLTFGTAHVFKLRETGLVVNNCHKFPSDNFISELINPKIMLNELSNAFEKLWKQNPELKIVLTVSPVRYHAFGVHENTVSKSYLFSAIQFLQDKFLQLYYFPSYELVMDDLRDYRFYADDLLHPNHLAIKYVWEKLCNTMMDENTILLMNEIEEIFTATNHRPRNANSIAHKKFVESILRKIVVLEKKTSLSFEGEKKLLTTN